MGPTDFSVTSEKWWGERNEYEIDIDSLVLNYTTALHSLLLEGQVTCACYFHETGKVN